MGRLFFRHYNAGLNNCRMSLDIGVALAFLTGRTLAPYDVKPPWMSDPLLPESVDGSSRPTVMDLFDLPVPIDTSCATLDGSHLAGLHRILPTPVYDSVLYTESSPPIDEQYFAAFRNGRKHVVCLADSMCNGQDMIVDVDTLGMYSYFFYLDSREQSELRSVLGRVRAKRPYRDLAERIAKSLFPFNAVHIRRGDFRYSGLTPRGHCISGEEVARNLASRLCRDEQLVVCTDSSSDQQWFAPLRREFPKLVFLDRMLLESKPWRNEFRALPFHDDVVLALVTQLVAAKGECFVGTLYSSFSALIQRLRGFEGRRPEFLYCYSDWDPALVRFERCEFTAVQDGPYSWNRILYPVDANATSWLREWPEAYQAAAAPIDPGVLPHGTLALRAREARIHGVMARYECSEQHDNIGYWNNKNDFVSWQLSLPRTGRCRIEVRYACPQESAGSTFAVELDGYRAAVATVASTGGWTLFSSWQILGKVAIAAGYHVLSVRILAMPGCAAMNLAGLRIVPASD